MIILCNWQSVFYNYSDYSIEEKILIWHDFDK